MVDGCAEKDVPQNVMLSPDLLTVSTFQIWLHTRLKCSSPPFGGRVFFSGRGGPFKYPPIKLVEYGARSVMRSSGGEENLVIGVWRRYAWLNAAGKEP